MSKASNKRGHCVVAVFLNPKFGVFLIAVSWQVEEARQELLSRLTPEAQAFLARRAAAKQTTKASTDGSIATTAGASSSTAGAQHVVPNNDSHTTAGKQDATNRDAVNRARAMPQPSMSRSAMPNHAEGIQTTAGPARRAFPGGSAGAAVSEGSAGSQAKVTSSPVSPSVRGVSDGCAPAEGAEVGFIARLRYSLEGQVVGLKLPSSPSSGPEADQQVVQRDILRYLNHLYACLLPLLWHSALYACLVCLNRGC